MAEEKKMFSATGNQMVADAMRQVNPDVMAAYPITPQTTIVEGYDKFCRCRWSRDNRICKR